MNKPSKTRYPLAGKPFDSVGTKSVHFIGVLGIGASSLAQWFLAQNWSVSGSDTALSPVYPMLKKASLNAKIGHKKANVPAKCGLIVYSQAIKPDNPELIEARLRKIPALSYPEAVGELTRFYETICVSGMHGKSTTTAMAGLTLVKAGLDPTIIIGTILKELGNRNFRAGNGPYLVLEADEYRDAFLNYSPAFSITTNLDKEHLDYFKNSVKIKNSFLKFFSGTKNGGGLILNGDNGMLSSLRRKIDGVRKTNNLRAEWYSLRNKEAAKIKKVIKLPGEHNVSNALAVFCLSKFLGISEKVFLSAVSEYKGAWRRMEYRGNFSIPNSKLRIPVYDDYGHHPTEIKATLAAFREKFPERELVCVFQPHQAERLKLLFGEFKTAFGAADKTIIMPIYKVAGRESVAGSKYDSEALVRSMQKMKPARKVFYLKEPKNLKSALYVLLSGKSFPCPMGKREIPRKKPAVIVMMGAGDIVNYTDSLISS